MGKLGLPCAVALNVRTKRRVIAYDVDTAPQKYLERREVPYKEESLYGYLQGHTVEWADSIWDVVERCDVIFVAVQTPHSSEFDGTTEFTSPPRDFEYGYLTQVIRDVAAGATLRPRPVTLVIVSTVLPGTYDRDVRPLLTPNVRAVYNPFFIAMGTVIRDFIRPEFVLLGADDHEATYVQDVVDIYAGLHDAPISRVSIASAELAKVAYNTFLTMKIVFANNVAEIADVTGADADEVTDSLALATERLLSPRYMRAGMGDGGGCHPRDNIALSWLAERHNLSFNLAGQMTLARELQSRRLAALATHWATLEDLGIIILGEAYKPETNLTAGSPATLLYNQLLERTKRVLIYDPHVREDDMLNGTWARAVYVIATNHEIFHDWKYPRGSVVIDPWGDVQPREGVTLIRPGRR